MNAFVTPELGVLSLQIFIYKHRTVDLPSLGKLWLWGLKAGDKLQGKIRETMGFTY